MGEEKAPELSWKRVEDTLSIAPPFPRRSSEPSRTAQFAHIALDARKTPRLLFAHGHHPDHPQAERPPDRGGSGQDHDPGRPGAGGTPPQGRPTGGSRCPVPLWRGCHQADLCRKSPTETLI